MSKTTTRSTGITFLSSLRKACLLVAASVFLASTAQAGNAANYTLTYSTGVALENLTTGATILHGDNVDDEVSPLTNIGFTFRFGNNVPYTQFSASSNGIVSLGIVASAEYGNEFFPSSAGAAYTTDSTYPYFAPLWDDLVTDADGDVRYKLVGTAPNQKLVIQWNVRTYNTSGGYDKTFQVWLNQNNNTVQFVYGNGTAPVDASIGIVRTLTDYQSITPGTPPTSSSTTPDNLIATFPASGTSYLFTSSTSLPVSLLSFNASEKSGTVALNWQAKSEEAIRRYEIERSNDAQSFIYLGGVDAGNKTGIYSFVDRSPLAGTSWYRLAIRELNGDVHYSPIAQVRTSTSGSTQKGLSITPSPAVTTVDLHALDQALKGKITVVDAIGRLMFEGIVGTGATRIDVSTWASGIYLVQTSTGETYKLLKR
ncbi:MAG: T9SS type A sorting domain-containing protein [Sphingobacteriales bacterium]|nr:MAG: T9SS type A sorting domain-containing protein [Sphingobacteriales bacterium]